MYFSRVRLNPSRRHTRGLLASPQTLHATVLASHPPGETAVNGRVLWRLDQLARHDLQLYVVSPVKPDFTGMLESAGWPSTIAWDTASYAPLLERLDAGQSWRFRLTANPVRSIKAGATHGSARGRISPHTTVRQQEEWLFSRAARWGFSVPDNTLGEKEAQLSERHTAEFGRRSSDGRRARRDRVSITRASYQGVLEVIDPEALRHALTHGMGRAKAYGCGLMTLASVQR